MDKRKERARVVAGVQKKSTPWGKDSDIGDKGTLNLNLSPNMHTTTEDLQGREVDAPSKNTTATNKFGGKGAVRGTARARRPPAVQPRYHTPVRFFSVPIHVL